jgi:hypothetical protein
MMAAHLKTFLVFKFCKSFFRIKLLVRLHPGPRQRTNFFKKQINSSAQQDESANDCGEAAEKTLHWALCSKKAGIGYFKIVSLFRY